MASTFVLFLAVFAFLSVASADYRALQADFDVWAQVYGKEYTDDLQYLHRMAIYGENVKRVQALNDASPEGGATFSLNKYADISPQEFNGKMLGYKPPTERTEDGKQYLNLEGLVAPDAFDWIPLGKVTPVKDQKQCGSCWAFSATENIESVWMIAKGLTPANMKQLAPQQIVDCDKKDGGCNGGDTPTAYEYVIQAGGMEPEADYPYRAVNEACHFNKADVFATISGFQYATKTKDENEMKVATATVAPLSICVDAEPWQFYSGGIMKKAQCGTSLDHCVQITGYDTSGATPYWIVRNSWGMDWGEKGFIRIEFGTNTCGVAIEATTATV